MPFLPFVYGYPSSCPRAHCTPNKSVPTLHYTRRPGPIYTGPCPKALTKCSPLDFQRSSITTAMCRDSCGAVQTQSLLVVLKYLIIGNYRYNKEVAAAKTVVGKVKTSAAGRHKPVSVLGILAVVLWFISRVTLVTVLSLPGCLLTAVALLDMVRH